MKTFLCGLLLAFLTLAQNPGPSKGGYGATAQQPIYVGHFDGSSTYAQTASTNTLTPPAESVTLWVHNPSSSGYATLYASNGAGGFQIYLNAGNLCVYGIASSGTPGGCAPFGLAGSDWSFLAVSYDSVVGLTVTSYYLPYAGTYVSVFTAAAAGTLNNATEPTEIGGNFPCCGGRYLTTQMADVRLYNRAITSAEVATLYGGGYVTSGLIDRWPLTEGTGTTVHDIVGSNDMIWGGAADGSSGYYDLISPHP